MEPDDPLCSRNARPSKDGGERLEISRRRFSKWGLRSDTRLRRSQKTVRKHHHPKCPQSRINSIVSIRELRSFSSKKGVTWSVSNVWLTKTN